MYITPHKYYKLGRCYHRKLCKLCCCERVVSLLQQLCTGLCSKLPWRESLTWCHRQCVGKRGNGRSYFVGSSTLVWSTISGEQIWHCQNICSNPKPTSRVEIVDFLAHVDSTIEIVRYEPIVSQPRDIRGGRACGVACQGHTVTTVTSDIEVRGDGKEAGFLWREGGCMYECVNVKNLKNGRLYCTTVRHQKQKNESPK